ncbi:MAG TPA: hypothetical protein VLA72_07785 [Anaerolineales bacterium]|nr:hypothetical protein [Anaerolineales bacterium]
MPKKPAPPKFDPTIYTKIILNDLVVYSIYYLHKQGSEITSEDIVSACFVLFPKRFSMRKYPQYPDSGIVSRRWGDCKSKGYLKGNATMGFQITARGIKRAEKVEKSLGKPMKPVRVRKPKTRKTMVAAETIHPELKAHAKKYVRSIEMSDAYKHYKKKLPLNEFDFRSLLLCTMESPPETLSRNLEQFREYVNMYERRDLAAFLIFCEEKFSHMLDRSAKQTKVRPRKARK